jgi:hypothetical protein
VSDFAKIIRAADGEQVLFFKSTDSESGKPQLRQVTEFEGMFAELNMAFTDDDAGWDKLDKCFDAADEAQANGVRAAIHKMLEGVDD